MDNLHNILPQQVLVLKFNNREMMVTWAFEDCQPYCLQHMKVGCGITSIKSTAWQPQQLPWQKVGGTGRSGWVEQITSTILRPSEQSIASIFPLSESLFMSIKMMSFSSVINIFTMLAQNPIRRPLLGMWSPCSSQSMIDSIQFQFLCGLPYLGCML